VGIDRRQFLTASAVAAGLAALPVLLRSRKAPAQRRLNILMLGGTGFLGPHTVQYALDRGHEVTLFNRGRTNADLFPDLEKIVGNRDPEIDDGLTGLEGRQWDAVIDTSGFVPRIVGASAGLLADHVGQYLFVSTICQYNDWMEGDKLRTEDWPRGTLEDPTTEDVGTHYCYLKAYCEIAAEQAMPGRVTQIRPGLIVGPRDNTDRFTYWPMRADRGGPMIAPGKPSDLTQYIDVRDLAAFIVRALEEKLTDSYNLVRQPMPWGAFLNACVDVADNDAELVWIPGDFLAEHELESWRQLQLWADSDLPIAGSLTWSATKAIDAGLNIRPLEETIRDTVAWYKSLPADRQAAMRSGIPADKEAEVMAAWQERNA
jgi:2'-hydroxyisoflavone reductase